MCVLLFSAFVERPPVLFSYRYSIFPPSSSQAAAATRQGSSSVAPRNLRQRQLQRGPEGFLLFAGDADTELLEKVKAVVAEQLGADINKITPQSHFIKVRPYF